MSVGSHRSYRTLVAELRYEIDKIKGSRFIATVSPVSSREDAEAFAQRVRSEFRNSRHTCYAYRLGPRGEPFRFNDDGEPSGSAGRPILQQLEGADVTDAICVVTRYFGGTKLGVGGLVRAYGGAAGEALRLAETKEVVVTRRVTITYPYSVSGAVDGWLAAGGLTASESDYGESVRRIIDLPEDLADEMLADFRDRTAGTGTVESPA